MLSDSEFRLLLEDFDLSWEGFRKVRKGVKKRLRRQVQALGLRRFTEYLDLIRTDAEERRQCRLLFTVSISRFFRDACLWRLLEQDILPGLSSQAKIKAWAAGCARGEEVYSLVMLHQEICRSKPRFPPLEVLATDINPDYLEQARAGVYQKGSLKELPPGLEEAYFQRLAPGAGLGVIEALRTAVTWRQHDLLCEGPPGRFHLILMRNNLLTYEGEAQRKTAVGMICGCLLEGGFLIIGRKERLPPGRWRLAPYLGVPCILRQQGPAGGW
ncbi:MAG: CheR family methyltransferase [Desulfarculaceae bacterium]|jgi:chemotaxis methyl-accepting protein methylase